MSKNVDETWAFYISGRNIHLYQLTTESSDGNGGYQVRLPEFEEHTTLKYPSETIASGLMFEGTAFIEPFVNNDPNELNNGANPTLTEEATPNEDSHLNLNRMLSLACVDYISANLEDRKGDVAKKEYYMKEFYSKLADGESNKRRSVMTSVVNPFALR
jgi:hypothetical protein